MQAEIDRLRAALAPQLPAAEVSGLSPVEEAFLSVLRAHPVASYEMLRLAADPLLPHDHEQSMTSIRVTMSRLRRKTGLPIRAVFRTGYTL